MFKTLLVGGGAVAVLWTLNSHASAGDVVGNVKNGVTAVQDGASAVQNGYSAVSNGASSLSKDAAGLQNGLSGISGGISDTVSGTNLGGKSTDSGGLSGPAVSINPASARPGQSVSISVPTCIQPTTGDAWSTVFSPNDAPLTRAAQGSGLAGTATIASNAQNGSWTVRVTCGTGANSLTGSTTISIFGGSKPTPVNPPKAGGGGSVMKGDIGMTAGGVALVAGGVGYGLWTMRRRGSASGTHVG
jgi:hypothetical protein